MNKKKLFQVLGAETRKGAPCIILVITHQFNFCPSRAPQIDQHASWGRDALFFVNWTKQKCTRGKQGPESGWFLPGWCTCCYHTIAARPLLRYLSQWAVSG